jgi:hypothetical protein
MARIRTIKPDFFVSDTVSALPLRARLTWIGLWTHCDDHGRCRDNTKLIKAAVWPLDDVSIRDIEIDLNTLADRGLIYRYVVDGKNYLAVTSWAEHQKVDRPSKSTIPSPEDTRDTLASPSRHTRAGRDREGNGREGTRDAREPPPRCPKHIDATDSPPCGACADARRSREQWERDKVAQLAAAPRCRRHRGEPAHNCGRCRSERLGAA